MSEERAGYRATTTAPAQARKPVTKETVVLSLHCTGCGLSDASEITCAQIEPHGAVLLVRFIGDGDTESFELSPAEVDALIATNKKRKALMRQYQEERNVPAPSELNEIPF